MRGILLSTVAAISLMMPVSDAEAATRLGELIQNYKKPKIQMMLAKRMYKRTERRVAIYERWLSRNARREGDRLYNRIYNLMQDYKEDLVIYDSILNPVAVVPVVTLVSTVSNSTDNTIVNVSDPVLVDTQIVMSESVDGNMVTVTETTTETYETTTTTKVVRTTTVTKTYSDGKVETSSSEEIISETVQVATSTKVDEVIVDQYALVDDVVEPIDEEVAEKVVLTVEEYAAREDVNIRYTDTFTDAAQKFNSRYSEFVANHDVGLGKYANWLESTGALQAWSRGYTGEGATIAILDSGIDTDHVEFEGSIVGAECFTAMCDYGYETIEDVGGHGTHVASIAAANMDGVGMTGVAPDADLLIGKVAFDNGYVQMEKVNDAAQWAIENGADAINLSAAVNFDRTYKSSIVEIGDGFYRSTDARGSYDTLGYNQLLASNSFLRPLAETIDNSEAVMVIAAGNQGTAVPSFPAHMAVMEDENGALAAGGQVLIAGAWDLKTEKIAHFSNRAGTMCFAYNETQNTCDSDRRISDYYLMAPGVKVTAADASDGGYRFMGGTSMAAPAIAGGVAVIHEMWPHMTGENIAKLMLNTADKDIPNYNVNVHGQGLMDLDEATMPQGAIGIPTTGRVEGAVASSGGTIAMSGVQLASLSSTMVIDDYDRDFYVDANQMNVAVDTRTNNPTLDALYGVKSNSYIGYANGMNIPVAEGTTISMSEDNFGFAQDFGSVTVGMVSEDGKFLGNMADSDLIRVNGADTVYASFNQEYTFGDTTFFGGASVGVTSLNVDSNTILKDASAMLSNSVEVGTRFNTSNGSFGIVASLPVAITSGTVSTEFASSVAADGTIASTQMEESFAASVREMNLGVFYDFNTSENSDFSVYAEHRENYAGVSGLDTQEVGLMYAVRF